MFDQPEKIPKALLAKIGRETLTTAAFKLERGESLSSFESVLVVQVLRGIVTEVEKIAAKKETP